MAGLQCGLPRRQAAGLGEVLSAPGTGPPSVAAPASQSCPHLLSRCGRKGMRVCTAHFPPSPPLWASPLPRAPADLRLLATQSLASPMSPMLLQCLSVCLCSCWSGLGSGPTGLVLGLISTPSLT